MIDREPDIITAGDSLEFALLPADYPASAGWSLKYCLRGAVAYDKTATADGDKHIFSIPASATVTFTFGDYWWFTLASKGVERHQLSSGQVTVKPNPTALTSGYDGRSQVKRTFDAIKAVLEGRASQDQSSYTIGGRSLSRTSIPDLIILRDKYAYLYRQELASARVSKGLSPGLRVHARF